MSDRNNQTPMSKPGTFESKPVVEVSLPSSISKKSTSVEVLIQKLSRTEIRDVEFKVGRIITLPSPKYFMNVPRFEFVNQSLLYTSTMDKLFHTVHELLPSVEDDSINLDKLEKQNKIYLYGNIGIGKSFHLFSLYHRLKQERKDLRILYIQNCKRVFEEFNLLSRLLQEVFSGGTAKDQAILDEIKKYLPFSRNISELDEIFQLIHKTFGKKFVIIVDQVNALVSPNSEKYSVEKKDLFTSLFGLKEFVTCLISSSANVESPARLEYYANFADFPMKVGFTKEEFIEYATGFNFLKRDEITNEVIAAIKYSTGFIPLEIMELFKRKVNCTCLEAAKSFDRGRRIVYQAALKKHLDTVDKKKFAEFMLRVFYRLEFEKEEFFVYGNGQFMYFEDGKGHFVSSLVEIEYRKYLFELEELRDSFVASADSLLGNPYGNNYGLLGTLIEAYIHAHIRMISKMDKKLFSIPCFLKGSIVDLSFGDYCYFNGDIDDLPLNIKLKDNFVAFPSNPQFAGFDFFLKVISISTKQTKMKKSINAFEARDGKKENSLFVKGNYSPVYLFPNNYFLARNHLASYLKEYNPIFMPMESFAESLNLKLLLSNLRNSKIDYFTVPEKIN